MDKIVGETKQSELYENKEEEEELQGVYNADSLYNKSPNEIKINTESINQLKLIEMIKKNETRIIKYFKDKSKYEKKIHEVKNKLRKSKDLTTRDKRREFKKLVKCIKCGKTGGTLFTNENDVLKEVCNASPPCKLNFEIKRIVVDNLIVLERKYTAMLNDVKKKIVIANMDLVFKYKSTNETVELFDKTLNISLEKSKDVLRLYSELARSIVNRNKEAIYEKSNAMKDEINGLSVNIPFMEPGGGAGEGGISNVDKYITNIVPLLKELRGLKYSYSGTECESSLTSTPCSESKDNIYVIQLPFTIKDMEVVASI